MTTDVVFQAVYFSFTTEALTSRYQKIQINKEAITSSSLLVKKTSFIIVRSVACDMGAVKSTTD